MPETHVHRSKVSVLLALSGTVPLVCLAVSLTRLKGSWDDGAITASFAQSWAHSGRIALTPLSAECEGFSSLLWFLLLSICPALGREPDATLMWMKLLSCAAFAGSVFAFYHVAHRFQYDRQTSAVATALLAFSITPFHEAYNGMEMNLSLLILLLLVWLVIARVSWRRLLIAWWALSALLLATRFESPFMLTALLLGCFISWRMGRNTPRPGILTAMAAGDLIVFVAICIWRHARFALWLPNTVYAKLWQPYHASSTLLGAFASRSAATGEIVIVLIAPLLVLTIVFLSRRLYKPALENRMRAIGTHPVILTLAAAGVLFGLIFGKNWGHLGRMVESLLPALILVTLDLLRWRANSLKVYRQALAAAIILHCVVWVGWNGRLLTRGDRPRIAEVETMGQGPDFIRRQLHLDHLTVMMPDVGGAGLYYPKLEILDSGLLTSPALAKAGFASLPAFFEEHQPAMVETHGIWSEVSHIYATHALDSYKVVGLEGRRFFLRPDLYAILVTTGRMREIRVTASTACMGDTPRDREASLSKRTCLVPITRTLE